MNSFNKGNVNKVLTVKGPDRARSDEFELDEFRLNTDKQELVH